MVTFGFDEEPFQQVAPTRQLRIELVPQSSWGDNLRSRLRPSDWDRVRKNAYLATGNRCEVCGGRGSKHPVEAHEVWEYDEGTGTQKLARVQALCPSCHEVKHFGLAEMRGNAERAFRHLMRVNGWSEQQAQAHLIEAAETWQRRSAQAWTLDLACLDEMGIKVREPEDD